MSIYCPLSEALGIEYVPSETPSNYQPDETYFLPNGKGPLNSFYGKKHTEETKQLMSEKHKGDKNHFYGKNHSEETKSLISERTKKGMENAPARTQEHNDKIRKALLGKHHTDERRKNISLSKKGIPSWNKGQKDKIVECPHCGKTGGNSNMKRWHFDNCKEKR